MNALRATQFEFRHRFWFIFAIFLAAYGLYSVFPREACVVLAASFAPTSSPLFTVWLRVLFGAGTLLVLLGGLLRTWGTAYLGSSVMKDRALHSEALTADGPFRFVRNPLYLGTLLLAAGLGLTADLPGWLLLVALLFLFQVRLILREEAGLTAAQGETYEAYRRAVPRLLPALRPRLPASGAVPKWREALLAESTFWFYGIALALLTITLNERLFWRVFFAGVLIGVIIHSFRRH